jgi:hypothetical protein
MSTKAKCAKCNDIIESKGNCHNFVSCKCGAIFVDGGDEYQRCGFDKSYHFLLWNEKKEEFLPMDLSQKHDSVKIDKVNKSTIDYAKRNKMKKSSNKNLFRKDK